VNLPPHLDAELKRIGVLETKPTSPLPSSKPTAHEPWKPKYDGEEPPF